ncbi:UNVERIFIED_CONTAM: hypothetical protein Sindi_2582200, partial [Sesamum indicum]
TKASKFLYKISFIEQSKHDASRDVTVASKKLESGYDICFSYCFVFPALLSFLNFSIAFKASP